ncbi:MAG: thermonuclease family protein [Armatimonadaceae bacterium]
MPFFRWGVVLAGLILLSGIARAQVFSGRVVGVSDGDTITVLASGNRQVKVRLDGIDAPESRQDYGQRAKQLASDLVFGKQVTVTTKERDRYGRTVGSVTVGGVDVNLAMVSAGMAWWYRQYAPGNAALERAESSARAARRGLWASSSPVPPWEFRRGGRGSSSGVLFPGGSAKGRSGGGDVPGAATPAPSAASLYRTTSGKKYHRDGCSGLRRSRIPVSLSEAVSLGLGPCGLCRP